MGWDAIKKGGESADYVQIEAGKPVRVHLLDPEPVTFRQHWIDKQPQRCRGTECPYCLEGVKGVTRHAINVWNMETSKVQILEGGNAIFSDIKAAWEAYEGDLAGTDFKIGKSGSGLDTEYSVVPMPTKFKPDLAGSHALLDIKKIYGIVQANGKAKGPAETIKDEEEINF